jgi:nucleotide-binding universal stress UspA family protein
MQIVVGVDFAQASQRALEWAIELGRRGGATLHLVHALYIPPEVRVGADWWAQVHGAAREGVSEMLSRIEKQGIPVEFHLVDEHPVAAILECAQRVEADLIALGARGASGLRLVTLGSVAERVARLAPCPVLTVPLGRSPA